MGRPRLYSTPEERREAHRRSSQKFHNNNRDALCEKRRYRYHKKVKEKKKIPIAKRVPSSGKLNNDLSLEPTAFVDERRMHLINITKGSHFGYVDNIVKACIKAPDDAIGLLTEAEDMWEQSISQIRDALAKILQDYGCGVEYKMASVTANNYRHLVTLLEDVHAFAVVQTSSQLEEGYHRGVFAYQSEHHDGPLAYQ